MEKEEKYRLLTAQVKSLIEGETDFVSVMANVWSVIHETMGFFWTGFYVVDEESHELHVGPFQGSVACMHIAYGRGVCGTAWKEAKTIVVPDVETFPGHIACSSLSRSEIVVPLFNKEGHSALIPAAIADYDLIPVDGKSRILDAFIDNRPATLARQVTQLLHIER